MTKTIDDIIREIDEREAAEKAARLERERRTKAENFHRNREMLSGLLGKHLGEYWFAFAPVEGVIGEEGVGLPIFEIPDALIVEAWGRGVRIGLPYFSDERNGYNTLHVMCPGGEWTLLMTRGPLHKELAQIIYDERNRAKKKLEKRAEKEAQQLQIDEWRKQHERNSKKIAKADEEAFAKYAWPEYLELWLYRIERGKRVWWSRSQPEIGQWIRAYSTDGWQDVLVTERMICTHVCFDSISALPSELTGWMMVEVEGIATMISPDDERRTWYIDALEPTNGLAFQRDTRVPVKWLHHVLNVLQRDTEEATQALTEELAALPTKPPSRGGWYNDNGKRRFLMPPHPGVDKIVKIDGINHYADLVEQDGKDE